MFSVERGPAGHAGSLGSLCWMLVLLVVVLPVFSGKITDHRNHQKQRQARPVARVCKMSKSISVRVEGKEKFPVALKTSHLNLKSAIEFFLKVSVEPPNVAE